MNKEQFKKPHIIAGILWSACALSTLMPVGFFFTNILEYASLILLAYACFSKKRLFVPIGLSLMMAQAVKICFAILATISNDIFPTSMIIKQVTLYVMIILAYGALLAFILLKDKKKLPDKLWLVSVVVLFIQFSYKNYFSVSGLLFLALEVAAIVVMMLNFSMFEVSNHVDDNTAYTAPVASQMAPPTTEEIAQEIEKFKKLRNSDFITEEEFQAKKLQILSLQ